ncbi:SSRP1 [Symbiodinium natans]|uniref:SSRP1 protein n=1 Tax=Symbiodinium natans TaxID=878477 RepID=A0A812KEX3_9DINO|nr:SSRP1 [Symbiodinium natans]
MRLHWVLFKTATWYSDRPKTTEDERPTVTLKDFCNPATNPGQKVLFELVQLLRDPARGFSAVCFFFGRFQDWPQARKRVALRSVLIVVGQLVRKIIEPFNTYPWQLATLADPDSDERIRRICARELFQAPPCCVDSGCSARLRATSVDACVSSDFMEFFQVLFERVVLTSTFVERRFAHFSHWTDVKGKGTSLCLLAAKHVTRTFKDVVDLWKKRTLPDTARGGTTNASRPSWCRKSQAAARLNGYHMFSQDRAADRDRSCQGAEESAAFLDDALQAWRALPEEEKQTWSQRARENNARKSALQMAAAAEMPPDVPGGPWNLSVPSEQWPLSEKFLGEFLESCGGFSTARNHWANAEPVSVYEDIDVRDNRSLFQVCPPGGCTSALSPAELACFHRLHTGLSVLIKRFDPAKKHISEMPLTLLFESQQMGVGVGAMLCFRTYLHNIDALLLRLDPSLVFDEKPPFDLRIERPAGGRKALSYWNDMSLCVEMASVAQDWVISRLALGDLQGGLLSFRVEGKFPHDLEELWTAAQQLKEQERALRALRLLQRAEHQRARRGGGRGRGRGARAGRARGRGRARQRAVPDDDSNAASGSGWDGDSEGDNPDDDDDGDDAWMLNPPGCAEAAPSTVQADASEEPDQEAAASGLAEEVPPPAPPPPPPPPPPAQRGQQRRPRHNQRRGVPWGPFELAPIVPHHGRTTGWGAICGLHRDRGEGASTTQCKKAVSCGAMDQATCLLRLKRWLCAGLDDDLWPPQRKRSHHVSMGGPGLLEFADGLSEEYMDEIIQNYVRNR